jgi:phosphohistidine swiveling domain-containing protein
MLRGGKEETKTRRNGGGLTLSNSSVRRLGGRTLSPGLVKGVTVQYDTGTPFIGKIVLLEGALTPKRALRLLTSAGVIVETGGVTSHGANILREFGIPCLVLMTDFQSIPKAAYVTLNATNAYVELPP